MAESFDLIVIGGGPGGYVCAIRAAQLGLKVACVEKRETLGGTCLNVGCIPSKALLQSSHLYEMAAHEMDKHGIKTGKVALDLDTMLARKDTVVSDLTKGIAFLFKKNKITHIAGSASFDGPGKVKVGNDVFEAKNIVIATGSDSAPLPGVEVDEQQIVTSTGALSLPKVPKSLAVIGAGVIGLELGSVWRRLGADVTVIEYLDYILPPMDGEVRKTAQRMLKKQGMNFKLASKVTGAKTVKSGVTLTVEPRDGGDAEAIDAEVVLLAIGRRPYTEGLNLDAVGLTTDDRGFLAVDAHLKTAVDGVYAIGDVIGGAMLAHKAEDEGIAVAETIAGQSGHVNYDAIPSVVYTHPEIAMVGRTEEQLKDAGIDYKAGKFSFMANSRAKANGEAEGFVKILADAKTDRVLGAHIMGPQAGELIAAVTLGMEFSAAAEDIARTCHAHPSLSEAVKESALAVDGRAIHS